MTRRNLIHESKMLGLTGLMLCGLCILPCEPGRKIIEYFKEKPKTRLVLSTENYSPSVGNRTDSDSNYQESNH